MLVCSRAPKAIALSIFAALVGAVFVLGCSLAPLRTPLAPNREWSDAELLDYVLVAHDRAFARAGSVAPTSSVLGQHNGIILVQTVSYNDVCCAVPSDFSLVVHYLLAKDSDCADIGGVSESLRVAAGYSSSLRQFCFPRVLAEHWREVAHKMSPE
jgi:hypothetical protein